MWMGQTSSLSSPWCCNSVILRGKTILCKSYWLEFQLYPWPDTLFLLSSEIMKEESYGQVVHWRALSMKIDITSFFLSNWVFVPSKSSCHELLITIFLNVISVNYKKAIMFEKLQQPLERKTDALCKASKRLRLGIAWNVSSCLPLPELVFHLP